MIRSPLVCLKQIFCAVFVLVSLLCALEIGLRCYRFYFGPSRAGLGEEPGLETNSWFTHHQLKPLETLATKHPDTNQPVQVTTNSYGLRGGEPTVPKPAGVFRVICLGDESTLAMGLHETETFCAQLEDLLGQQTQLEVDVINAGVPGFCPLLCYLQVKHVLLSLGPDLLILNFDMSDVADDHRYRRHTRMDGSGVPLACPHTGLDFRRPRRRLEEEFLLPKWCLRQVGRFSSEQNQREDRQDIDTPHGQYAWLGDESADWSVYIWQALLPVTHLRAIAERIGAQLVVATYPAPWQVSPEASSGAGVRQAAGVPEGAFYEGRRPFQLVGSHLAEQGILFCDTSFVFRSVEQADRLFFRNAPRFSEQGHTLYARELARFLVGNVSGPWNRGSIDATRGVRSRRLPGRPRFSANH